MTNKEKEYERCKKCKKKLDKTYTIYGRDKEGNKLCDDCYSK